MIVAFYSYKGGVGRTLAAVHTALLMARALRRPQGAVLVVDLDLEAPGLHRYLPGAPGRGLLGLLDAWDGASEAERDDILERALDSHVVASADLPGLAWLPTGLEGAPDRYRELVNRLEDEADAQPEADDRPQRATVGFLAALRRAMDKRFPYTFVDARTGLADAAWIGTILLADALVLCMRLNEAQVAGAESVLGTFLLRENLAASDPRAPYIPVFTPVPARGGTDVRRWLGEEARSRYGRVRLEGVGTADAPLMLFGPAIRLYHEPTLEIDEGLLLRPDGSWRAGFDGDEPLARGYRSLRARLRVLNAMSDAWGAAFLEDRLERQGELAGAVSVWGRRVARDPRAWSRYAWYVQEYPAVRELLIAAATGALPQLAKVDADSAARAWRDMAEDANAEPVSAARFLDSAAELAVEPLTRASIAVVRAELEMQLAAPWPLSTPWDTVDALCAEAMALLEGQPENEWEGRALVARAEAREARGDMAGALADRCRAGGDERLQAEVMANVQLGRSPVVKDPTDGYSTLLHLLGAFGTNLSVGAQENSADSVLDAVGELADGLDMLDVLPRRVLAGFSAGSMVRLGAALDTGDAGALRSAAADDPILGAPIRMLLGDTEVAAQCWAVLHQVGERVAGVAPIVATLLGAPLAALGPAQGRAAGAQDWATLLASAVDIALASALGGRFSREPWQAWVKRAVVVLPPARSNLSALARACASLVQMAIAANPRQKSVFGPSKAVLEVLSQIHPTKRVSAPTDLVVAMRAFVQLRSDLLALPGRTMPPQPPPRRKPARR